MKPELFFIQIIIMILLGLYASKKNRNAWGWGILGSFVLIISLPLLIIMPPLCIGCKKRLENKGDRKEGLCVKCQTEDE